MKKMCRRAFLQTSAAMVPFALWARPQTKKKVAVVSEDDCIGCGACVDECPVEAITMDDDQGLALVDKVRCESCGDCVKICPTDAISMKEVEVGREAGGGEPPRKKEDAPRPDAGGALVFDIVGAWTITAKFPGDDQPVTAKVKFAGTPAKGEMTDGETGEKQATYTVTEGRVELVFSDGTTGRAKFTSPNWIEGTLPGGGTWTAERKK